LVGEVPGNTDRSGANSPVARPSFQNRSKYAIFKKWYETGSLGVPRLGIIYNAVFDGAFAVGGLNHPARFVCATLGRRVR